MFKAIEYVLSSLFTKHLSNCSRLLGHRSRLLLKFGHTTISKATQTFGRATLRANRKVRCLVDELHRKLALWLCRSFRTIIIPVFATQQMVTHKQGRTALRPKTSRAMCTWSHYRFRTNLKHKAKCFPGVSVIETTEQYTSKTCGACGQLNHDLREEKTFVCDACGFVCDRDFNAARNILIRYLTVKQIPLS